MKQKLNLLVALTLILAIGFVGCQKEDADLGAAKVVSLKILPPAGPATYAIDDAIADGTAVNFGSGHIYFTNADGVIMNYFAIDSDDAENLVDTHVQYTVSPAVVKAYIVGNTAATTSSPNLAVAAGGNISAVEGAVLAIASQANVDEVNLWGTGALEAKDGSVEEFTCAITLTPTVARLEIAKLTATGNIASYEVSGIFVDRYFAAARVDGVVTDNNFDTDVEFGGLNAGYYVDGAGIGAHKNATLYQWYTTAQADNGGVVVANESEATKVWSYQLFADPAVGGPVPKIIIRLNDVVVGATTLPNPQFITVKGLHDVDASEDLAKIVQSNIYNIANIAFDETNLSPTPNLEDITVDVTVTLATWSVNEVTPIL